MAITLSSEPGLPLPNKTAKLTFTPSGGGNYVRLLCTNAPLGSELKNKLIGTGASVVAVLEGDTASKFDFTPDKSGVYVFSALEITKGASAGAPGPGYQNDPDGYGSETIVSTTPVSLRVGSRLTMPLGAGPDTATLVLYVWNANTEGTIEGIHGETSPQIIDPKTDRARNAALNTAVSSLIGAASTIVGTPSTVVTNLIDKFNAHLAQATVHAANDTDNAIDGAYRNPTTPEALKKSVGELLRKFSRHILNDNGSGPGSAGYHAPGAVRAGDWAAKPIAEVTSDLANTLIALAGLHLHYETHRATAGAIHNNADGTNVAAALPALLAVHSVFLGELVKTNPTAPSTANSGTVVLVSAAGMREG